MSARRGRCGRDGLLGVIASTSGAARPTSSAVSSQRPGGTLPNQPRTAPRRSSPITLVEIVASYPEADTIHLVMDNLSSHNRKALVDRFGEKIGGLLWERFTVHYTPKHGSWLNQAEIEISLFSRQCLGQRRIPSLSDLRREAKAWNRKMNRNHVTINWQFTRKKARQKFGYDRNKITRSET
jgi:transposase